MSCDPLKQIRAFGERLWGNLASLGNLSPVTGCDSTIIDRLEHQAQLGGAVTTEGKAVPGSGATGKEKLAQIAAAYCLWPYYAALYYRYPSTAPAADEDVRLRARENLCAIQRLLFTDLLATLDSLRCLLRVRACQELSELLLDNNRKTRWGNPLVEFIPDLCAVDFLADEVLRLVRAVPLVHEALSELQGISLGAAGQTEPKSVRDAFTRLGVGQLTIFYHSDPTNLLVGREVLLREFVCETTEELEGLPARLVPFSVLDEHGSSWLEDPDAKSFRTLADAIYSAPGETFEWFKRQRQATLERIGGADDHTGFVASGETTDQFLTHKPPADDWPIWYARALQDLASGVTIEDWSKANWWTKYKDPYEVVPHLFPGPAELHANYHASAYFDYLAGEKRHLLVSWGDLIEHFPKTMPTNDDEKFGYLMELLLRRQEKLTRTSVLFRLGQTFDQNEPQLCQFVGGTFLGLERPGVPFEETRFHSFADHLRPLVVGLVHFCTTRLVEKRQRQRRQFREDFHKAIEGILRLLEVGLRPDDQSLLYSSDHDKYTGPSRVRVKNLFSPHWSESLNSGGEGPESDCDNVWKSLLEIGDDDTCKTLEQFLSDPISDPMMSRKKIKCKECLCDACGYLLGKLWDGPRDLKSKTDIIIGSGITLPSRPGIRFLMCVCDFIVATEADEKRTSRLCRLVIKPGELEMEFTDYEIVKAIREYNFAPRGPTTRGPKEEAFHLESRFRAFRKCAPPISSDGEWGRFLTMREFAGGYRIVTSNTQPKLLLRWSPLL